MEAVLCLHSSGGSFSNLIVSSIRIYVTKLWFLRESFGGQAQQALLPLHACLRAWCGLERTKAVALLVGNQKHPRTNKERLSNFSPRPLLLLVTIRKLTRDRFSLQRNFSFPFFQRPGCKWLTFFSPWNLGLQGFFKVFITICIKLVSCFFLSQQKRAKEDLGVEWVKRVKGKALFWLIDAEMAAASWLTARLCLSTGRLARLSNLVKSRAKKRKGNNLLWSA